MISAAPAPDAVLRSIHATCGLALLEPDIDAGRKVARPSVETIGITASRPGAEPQPTRPRSVDLAR